MWPYIGVANENVTKTNNNYYVNLRCTSMVLFYFVVDGLWADWTNWTMCSADCGGGAKNRERTCSAPEPAHGGMACDGPVADTADCNTTPCP